MNKQELEKWIAQNRFTPKDSQSFQDVECIEVEDLRELLKTHAIVPRDETRIIRVEILPKSEEV